MENHKTLTQKDDTGRTISGKRIIGIRCEIRDMFFISKSIFIPGMEYCPYCGQLLNWKGEIE